MPAPYVDDQSAAVRSPDSITDDLIYRSLMQFRAVITALLRGDHRQTREQRHMFDALIETTFQLRFAVAAYDEYSDGRPIVSVIEVDDIETYCHLWAPRARQDEHVVHSGLTSAPGSMPGRHGRGADTPFRVIADDLAATLRVEHDCPD